MLKSKGQTWRLLKTLLRSATKGETMKKVLKYFTPFEWCLMLVGLATVTLGFVLGEDKSALAFAASFIGIFMLLLNAKGSLWGQIIAIVYGILYGTHAYMQHYYGEMLIYFFFMLPMYVFTLFSWKKNKQKGEVKVNKISAKEFLIGGSALAVATVGFYFLLVALKADNALLSTFPIITCVSASYLLFRRSEYYALAFILNDVFMIVLWSIKLFTEGTAVLPSVLCFIIFLVSDTYSFILWKMRKRKQSESEQNNL